MGRPRIALVLLVERRRTNTFAALLQTAQTQSASSNSQVVPLSQSEESKYPILDVFCLFFLLLSSCSPSNFG